jgi:hypothetical protein
MIFLIPQKTDLKNTRNSLALYSISLGLTDFVKYIFYAGESGITASLTPIEYLTNVSGFWPSTVVSFKYMFGGLYSNLLLLLLILIGILFYRPSNDLENVNQIFLGLSSAVFLIGNQMVKSRIFYNIPITIFAAQGFLLIFNKLDLKERQIFFAFTIISMMLYLFRSVANLI